MLPHPKLLALLRDDDLIWYGTERGFAHLLGSCPAFYFFVKLSFLVILISCKRLGPFLRLCATPTCREWVTAESVWQLVRETSGAVMSPESWIPSL